MIKKILQGITFFVLIVFSLSSFCQQIDENILLKRFRAYHEYDSVSGIVGVDSVMLYAKQKEIIEIDNKIFGDYIVSKDLEGKKSRVNILIDQVNTLDEELFYKSERLLLLYMISAFFIIGFGVFLFLYLQLSKKFSRTYDEFERYRDDIEFQKESFDSREDLNDEHVEEFQSALSNYKQELRKASEFIIKLRTEKINAENSFEEQKDELLNLQQKNRALSAKLKSTQDSDNKLLEKISEEKSETEEKYNQLYKEYASLIEEIKELRVVSEESNSAVTKQKTESETVRKELLEWIASKNDELKRIKAKSESSDSQLLLLRGEIVTFLNDQPDVGSLSMSITGDTDTSTLVTELRKLIKDKEDSLSILQQNMRQVSLDSEYIKEKSQRDKILIQGKEEELERQKKMLQNEYEKRIQLENDLSSILNRFKG